MNGAACTNPALSEVMVDSIVDPLENSVKAHTTSRVEPFTVLARTVFYAPMAVAAPAFVVITHMRVDKVDSRKIV